MKWQRFPRAARRGSEGLKAKSRAIAATTPQMKSVGDRDNARVWGQKLRGKGGVFAGGSGFFLDQNRVLRHAPLLQKSFLHDRFGGWKASDPAGANDFGRQTAFPQIESVARAISQNRRGLAVGAHARAENDDGVRFLRAFGLAPNVGRGAQNAQKQQRNAQNGADENSTLELRFQEIFGHTEKFGRFALKDRP